ncbi:MAG: hypothetical protein CMO47_01995 [Verrucomicrobiales bacterium]|nr:hypothetical protein [Verrucomicrobiales bacterium]|tara:strand:+ start:3747 stop:5741 length:1995 start_codon:yes stop_codon:yes gene_type:complete
MRAVYVVLLLGLTQSLLLAQETRFTEPVTLHDYHPFRSIDDGKNWEARKQEIRSRIQLAAGLLPFPERTPLNAQRYGAVQRKGFQVERVFFESFPGHFVTGSLFTPTGDSLAIGLVDGKRPGVLCPHGHWPNGRFFDQEQRSGSEGVRRELAIGAERFQSAAHNPIIARCVHLARMGCVVLVYDMIGYADSVQLEEHRHGSREEMNSPEPGQWGFVSPQATLRLQTNFGLHTWNSVRALDYLTGIPGVDPDRLLVTGASGGATQTMVLAAIDKRVDAAFPAVMLSTAMQGGCTCENSHYLRIDQGNVDIGAAFAPKPLGITSADDWTIELEIKGHPDLKALYEQLKVPGNYSAHFNTHFKHNFNQVSRAQMYDFVNQHFELGLKPPVLERDYERLLEEDLTVFTDGAPVMEGYQAGDDHERALNEVWADDSDRALRAALGGEGDWLAEGWDIILRTEKVRDTAASFELKDKTMDGDVVRMNGTISRDSDGDTFWIQAHYPSNWSGKVVIRLEDNGIEASVDEVGGNVVLIPNLYGQNDELAVNAATSYSGKKEVTADSWRRSPVYFYGYNDSVFVRRVHDVVSTAAMVRDHPKWDVKEIEIEAKGALAAVALAAKVILGDQIHSLAADLGDFRFQSVDSHWDDFMVPGSIKYGDVAGLRYLAEQ